jgi:hypothetical protein
MGNDKLESITFAADIIRAPDTQRSPIGRTESLRASHSEPRWGKAHTLITAAPATHIVQANSRCELNQLVEIKISHQ